MTTEPESYAFDLTVEVVIEMVDPEDIAGFGDVVQARYVGVRAIYPERSEPEDAAEVEWKPLNRVSECEVAAWADGVDLAYRANRSIYLTAVTLSEDVSRRGRSDEGDRLRSFYDGVAEWLRAWFIRRGLALPTDHRDSLQFMVEEIIVAVVTEGPDHFPSNKALYNWAADFGGIASNASDPSNTIRKALGKGFENRYGFAVPSTPSEWFEARDRLRAAHGRE